MVRTCSTYISIFRRGQIQPELSGPIYVKPMSFRLSCRLYMLLGLSSQGVAPYDLIKCSLSFPSKLSTIKLP